MPSGLSAACARRASAMLLTSGTQDPLSLQPDGGVYGKAVGGAIRPPQSPAGPAPTPVERNGPGPCTSAATGVGACLQARVPGSGTRSLPAGRIGRAHV